MLKVTYKNKKNMTSIQHFIKHALLDEILMAKLEKRLQDRLNS
jgi:hypothetical protein